MTTSCAVEVFVASEGLADVDRDFRSDHQGLRRPGPRHPAGAPVADALTDRADWLARTVLGPTLETRIQPRADRASRGFKSSPSLDEALNSLVRGHRQAGAAARTLNGDVVIGWGRRDRVTLASQAKAAIARFRTPGSIGSTRVVTPPTGTNQRRPPN